MGTPINTSRLSANPTPDIERVREQLQLWAQRHRGLTDIFLDAFCIVDPANRVVEFNEAFTELCGESYRKILKIGDFCELVKTEKCPGECPARQILTSGKPLRLDEFSGVTKAFPQLQMILGGVPIFSEAGEPLGSLITIRNVQAESELQKKYKARHEESVTDGLTRLYNKTYAESLLLRLLLGTLREIHTLTVVMCDIDHFKKVNDTFGHQAGDYVLSTVAHMFRGQTRESDIVGRFGGEEFIVVLPNTDAAGAKIFCERFRKRIEATPFFFEGRPIPVTLSLGTKTLGDRNEAKLNAEVVLKELVSHADTALYFAKTSGRNRTQQYEALPEGALNPVKKAVPR